MSAIRRARPAVVRCWGGLRSMSTTPSTSPPAASASASPPPPLQEPEQPPLGDGLRLELKALISSNKSAHLQRQRDRYAAQLPSSTTPAPFRTHKPSVLQDQIKSLQKNSSTSESSSDVGSLALLRAQAYAGDVANMLTTFSQRSASGYAPIRPKVGSLTFAHDDYLIVLNGLSRAKATTSTSWWLVSNCVPSTVDFLLDNMRARGLAPSAEHVLEILDAYARVASVPSSLLGANRVEANRVISASLDLLTNAREGKLAGGNGDARLRIDITTEMVNRVLKVCCRANELERAFDILNKYLVAKSVPNLTSFPASQQQRGQQQQLNTLSPDTVTFNTLLHGFARRGDVLACLDIIAAMSTSSAPPCAITVEGLVAASLMAYNSEKDMASMGGMGGVAGAISSVQSCWNQYRVLPRPSVLHDVLELSLIKGEVYEGKRCVFLLRQIVGTTPPPKPTEGQDASRIMVLRESLSKYQKDGRFTKEAIKALFAKHNFSTDKM